MEMMQVGIALGSNIEPRIEHLHAALRKIESLFGDAQKSRIYETAPVDCPEGSSSFLNAVIEIETELGPEELLKALQQIERDLGRPEVHGWNTPRTIDLDILYYGEMTLDLPGLTVPHPRIGQRRFVLQPLADIRPELVLPAQAKSISELLAELPDSDEVKPLP